MHADSALDLTVGPYGRGSRTRTAAGRSQMSDNATAFDESDSHGGKVLYPEILSNSLCFHPTMVNTVTEEPTVQNLQSVPTPQFKSNPF